MYCKDAEPFLSGISLIMSSRISDIIVLKTRSVNCKNPIYTLRTAAAMCSRILGLLRVEHETELVIIFSSPYCLKISRISLGLVIIRSDNVEVFIKQPEKFTQQPYSLWVRCPAHLALKYHFALVN